MQKGFLVAEEKKNSQNHLKLWVCLKSAILIASTEGHYNSQDKYIHYSGNLNRSILIRHPETIRSVESAPVQGIFSH